MKTLPRQIAILCIGTALSACAAPPPSPTAPPEYAEADCHPDADAGQPQYIVGYGSLMQDESRKRTSPQAGPAHPVEVSGFRRGWFAKGDPVGFSTTYLGVTPDPHGRVNAVVYAVETSELVATDRRESSYCRKSVPMTAIKTLEQGTFEVAAGQAWIYVNRPQAIAAPSARYPIVQSYVDIFLSGCLEQEQRFALNGFAQRCVATTGNWSEHWVNDRLYPRRPFIYQPRSRQIDALLARNLPEYFARIRIEGAHME
ncbi:MAG TPA: gamma-glutamylcyclotransferase family protein [Burkholderiaceae bacterium]|nr:gamma-glutamylcyclotransferase family protein [Burkholderiaceae bacterium]